MRRLALALAGSLVLTACSADLPHEAPYDDASPAAKQARATLAGTVALAGETDAGGVAVRLANGARAYSFTTANDGQVAIPGVVPGTYTLTISSRYFVPVAREVTLALGETKTFDPVTLALRSARVRGNAKAVKIVNRQSLIAGGVQIVLTKIGSIRGGGAAAPAFRAAAAAAAPATTYTTLSGPDGTYAIDGVAAGEYQVTAANDEVAAQDAGTVTVTGESEAAVADVLLEPLTGYFSIRGTAADGPSKLYTRTATVELELAGFNAVKMKIGRSASGAAAGCAYPAATVAYAAAHSYVIPAPGVETVCVRFVDATGHETGDLVGTIVYDDQAPKLAGVLINEGALASGALQVGVRFSAVETESTLHAYQLVNALPADWSTVPKYAYQPTVLHTLAGQGLQTVYARFQDAAGNWAGPVSAAIEVSTVPPTGTAALVDDQGGAIAVGATTRANRVYVVSTLTSQTTLEMQVSTTGSYTGTAWEPYAASKPVDLPPQTGFSKEARQVSARVRDAVGRTLDLINAQTFYLDGRGPTGSVAAPTLVSSLAVPLTLTVNDPEAWVEVAENPAFMASTSFAFRSTTTYTLAPGEGQRTLYVRFADAAGNYSALAAAVLQVDTVPPKLAAVSVRQGALTRVRTIDLDLTALDAAEMSVAEGTTCTGAWEPFAATRQLTFAADVDGVKNVAVKFRDTAGNETACLPKTVTYDKTPPVPGVFQINAGAAYARDRAVTLSIAVNADGQEMQLAETPVFSGAWQPVTSTASYTLSAGDGAKTLYLEFRDAAGNTALATPAVIQLDTVGPEQPLVTVNDGSGYARQITAALTLSATGSPSHYRWTVDGVIDNKPWLAFTTATSVSLGGTADGPRSVAVQFKDPAGNLSLAAQAAVYLDRQAPLAPSLRVDDGAATTRSSAGLVTLTLNAADTGSGLATVRLAPTQAGLAGAAALPFEPTKVYTLDAYGVDGKKTVWASFYDKAGNYSAPVSASIRLDRTAPTAALSLPAGSLSATGIVPVTLGADADTVSMLVSNQNTFAGAAWEPYQSSFTYAFPAVEGPATLYVRLRDDAGNESGTFSRSLTIDTTPPVVAGVAAAVVSDTLVWDDLNPDAVSYTVYLFDGGTARSTTTVTAKRLYVGHMNPGFTVVANYADGSKSAYSQSPGYAVPATFSAFLGLRATSAGVNAKLAALAAQYGLGTTTAGCAQVIFTENTTDGNALIGGGDKGPVAGDPSGGGGMPLGGAGNGYSYCRGTHAVRLLAEYGGDTPPPFDAALASVAGNPFAGLPPLRVSGGGRGWYYSNNDNEVKLLTVPGWQIWPGANYPQAQTGDAVASMGLYDPATGTGSNEIKLWFPLAALAVTDDATLTYDPTPDSPAAYGYLGAQGLAFAATGRFAGIDVTDVDFRNRYWESYLTFNGLWDFNQNTNYNHRPGVVRLPFYASDATYDATSLTAASLWSSCNYDYDPLYGWIYTCAEHGKRAHLDLAAGDLTMSDDDPYGWYSWGNFAASNADGSRSYTLPWPRNAKTTLHWKSEYPQAAFGQYLKAMVRKVAAPVRVRGTGAPLLTNSVSGVTEMLVGTDANFTGAVWRSYASEITLPEGTQSVWVRYRDAAGNTTPAQPVAIAAPVEAPRLDEAVILGAAGNPQYTTGPGVTAYLLGTFPSNVWVRASTNPTFQDDGWVAAEALSELEITDPLTGEKRTAELDGMQVAALPMTIPDVPGTYTYYFWVKDASRNFSRMKQAVIVYDTSKPDAEFSLKGGDPGEILVQARWSVSTSPLLPSLAALAPAPATTYALPFTVPFLGTYAGTLWIDDAKVCLQVGYLNACPLTKLGVVDDHSVILGARQATVVWRGHGPYETPVTAAATVFADGSVRLSYWYTGARMDMRGEVDGVETPYADYKYAAVQGSVDYRPNQLPLQLLLKSHKGKLYTVNFNKVSPSVVPGGYWSVSSPWRQLTVTERGLVRFTGTAFSAAGNPGSVTVREVYVGRGTTSDQLTNPRAVPLTDTRWRLSWDLDPDLYDTAFRVDGAPSPMGALAGGLAGEKFKIAESQKRAAYTGARTNQPWDYVSEGPAAQGAYGRSLVLVDDGRIATSGAPVAPDFEARLLYGADGSIWDLADPRKPVPVRAFTGTYPERPGNAVRVGNYLWTQSGIYDVSSPEAPWRVAGVGSPRSLFAVYHGLVYEFDALGYWIYDPAMPWGPTASSTFSWYSAGTQLFRTGGRILSPNWEWVSIDVDAAPLAPDTQSLGCCVSNGYVDAGDRGGDSYPVASSGFLRYTADGAGRVTPRFGGSAAAPEGSVLAWAASEIQTAGPWLFGRESDGLRIAHAGQALPGENARVYVSSQPWNTPRVDADAHYLYVCDDTTLSVFNHAGALAFAGAVKGCNGMSVQYPWVVFQSWRYRVDGGAVVEDPLTFCDPFATSGYTYCPEGEYLGTAYRDWSRKLWVGADNRVALNDSNCEPMAATGSLVFCYDYGTQDVKAGPFTPLAYRGAVTGPAAIPLVKILNDGSQFQSAQGEHFVTQNGTYWVKSLTSVVRIGPGGLRFTGPGQLTDGNGTLYAADRDRLRKVAAVPGMTDLAVSANGRLLQTTQREAWVSAWGPAEPEYRLTIAEGAGARGLVQSAGYVYLATPSGLARTDGLMHVASAVRRPDLTVHHAGDRWELRGDDLRPVTTAVSAAGDDADLLCTTLLKRYYKNPQEPWNPPYESVCQVQENAPAARIFEGDLGEQWLGLRGVSVDAVGDVSSVAVDEAGRVYAGVQTGATTGVYFYDPADTTLTPAGVLATGPVIDLAVAGRYLYVLEASGDLTAYDMRAGYLAVWTTSTGGATRVRAADGHVATNGDGFSSVIFWDVSSGGYVNSCGSTSDFVFAKRRWGGQLHTVIVNVDGPWVYAYDTATCATVEHMQAPTASRLVSVHRESGFLLLGNLDGELFVAQEANFAKRPVFTVLKDTAPMFQGTLVGPFVYAIGPDGGGIWQLH